MILGLLPMLLACARPGPAPTLSAAELARSTPVRSGEASACPTGSRAPRSPDLPAPVQEPLPPGDGPTLMLSQAWFYKQNGRPAPGAARLLVFRQTPTGWASSRLEDADSNVFHQGFALGAGVVTLGAERALLRLWKPGDGGWSPQTLFEGDWCGRFDRLRELERGDLDGDGTDEWVIATHDQGVIVVLSGAPGQQRAVELDEEAGVFVHEIELGDLTGDGRAEIVATRTRRAGELTHSDVVMLRWTPEGYRRETLLSDDRVAVREVLLADLDRDGHDEIYLSVPLTERPADGPPAVELRRLRLQGGDWTAEPIARIADRAARFLVEADLDGDQRPELVATSMRSGVYRLLPQPKGVWPMTRISDQSGGFEHVAAALDLDEDGRDELYVADDDHAELERVTLDPSTGAWRVEVLGTFDRSSITWNIARGP